MKTHYLLIQRVVWEDPCWFFVCFEDCGSQHELKPATVGSVHLKELQKFVAPLCLN